MSSHSHESTGDQSFRHYSPAHRAVAWVSQTLFNNVTYTVRHGLNEGMKRKGGLGWLPKFMAGASTRTAEEVFWRKCELGDVIIYDIGAFQGLLTLFFASQARQVVSYEPNSKNHARLMENIRLNHLTNVLVRNVALGAKQETAEMVALPLMSGGASIASNTIKALHSSNLSVVSERITVTTLDDDIRESSLPPPDFIKVDVEGSELALLMGARETLLTYKPKLFIELHGETMNLKRRNVAEIVGYLNELGYTDIRHIESTTAITQANSATAAQGHLHCG